MWHNIEFKLTIECIFKKEWLISFSRVEFARGHNLKLALALAFISIFLQKNLLQFLYLPSVLLLCPRLKRKRMWAWRISLLSLKKDRRLKTKFKKFQMLFFSSIKLSFLKIDNFGRISWTLVLSIFCKVSWCYFILFAPLPPLEVTHLTFSILSGEIIIINSPKSTPISVSHSVSWRGSLSFSLCLICALAHRCRMLSCHHYHHNIISLLLSLLFFLILLSIAHYIPYGLFLYRSSHSFRLFFFYSSAY